MLQQIIDSGVAPVLGNTSDPARSGEALHEVFERVLTLLAAEPDPPATVGTFTAVTEQVINPVRDHLAAIPALAQGWGQIRPELTPDDLEPIASMLLSTVLGRPAAAGPRDGTWRSSSTG